uniref:Uncharacterized protein n=1 Tax=Anguilla anguilla TaxID=7936 RepID=A0A0E9VKL9_ANGAN
MVFFLLTYTNHENGCEDLVHYQNKRQQKSRSLAEVCAMLRNL